jgi:hypothetical protein
MYMAGDSTSDDFQKNQGVVGEALSSYRVMDHRSECPLKGGILRGWEMQYKPES